MATKHGLMERLDAGEVVIGDGGYVFIMEKRGYVKAGPWTPECVVEHPEAVLQLHREFLRAGADVLQALTFYASEDKLENRGNYAGQKYTCSMLNAEACKLAHQVVAEGTRKGDEGTGLVTASVSQTPSYLSGAGKARVQEMFKIQIDAFVASNVDFLICEYFEHVEEAEWATEVAARSGLPVVTTLCIGPEGDMHGVSASDCAVRLAKAGANVVGLNCHFDPFVTLKAMAMMKEGLVKAGLFADPKSSESKKGKVHLAAQPLGFLDPDAGKQGFIDLPEFPFALEPRVCTRFDYQRYAREAYEMGIRYIGGCCGSEPHHIRGIAEELSIERNGKLPTGSEKHDPWAGALIMHTKPWVRARARRAYWEKLEPATGRPYSSSCSRPNEWGVTAGSEMLKQQKEQTSAKEIENLVHHAESKLT